MPIGEDTSRRVCLQEGLTQSSSYNNNLNRMYHSNLTLLNEVHLCLSEQGPIAGGTKAVFLKFGLI